MTTPNTTMANMDSQRWSRVSDLFAQAADLAPELRDAWLQQHCGGDAELRAAVQRLLDADADAGDFLAQPMFENRALDDLGFAEPWDPAPGHDVGPYRLLQLIGRGGMGQVFLAERNDGQFEQRVALKLLLHPGAALLRRFLAERQILARLEHPNIARLLDGGVGRDGVPYFAMEYVDGIQIIAYCEQHALDLRARLQLFVQVCEAVHYAHRNLVVHRDIKPSNILVTHEGQPKLLDFGIAKLLEITGSPDGAATQTLSRMLTPDYAAPEQIRGQTITTATDVYSLGVVLYELLTEQRPYRLGESMHALEKAILDTDPAAPSSVLSTTVTELRLRGRALRGDLDRIVLKALQKEPERRYLSAQAFAADVQRYLDGRPIAARSDSVAYRARKFVRRNRLAVISAALVFVALIAATSISLYQAHIARDQVRRAEYEARTSREVKGFLTSLFTVSDPNQARGESVTARELLDRGAARVQNELADDKPLQQEMALTIGGLYSALGLYPRAMGLLDLAVTSSAQQFGETDPRYADALLKRSFALREQSQYDKAHGDLDRAMKIYRVQTKSVALAPALSSLALLYQRQGKYTEGEVPAREALALDTANAGADSLDVARDEQALAELMMGSGKNEEAVILYRHALDVRIKQLGKEHADVAQTWSDLGVVQWQMGKLADAETSNREALAIRRKLLGPQHPLIAVSLTQLGAMLRQQGKLDDAKTLLEEALAMNQKTLGEHSQEAALNLNSLALLAMTEGDLDTAAARFQQAIDIHRATGGDEHPFVATGMANLGAALTRMGRYGEAETALNRALELHHKAFGETHALIGNDLNSLAMLKRREGKFDEAQALLEQAIAVNRKALGEAHQDVAYNLTNLAWVELDRGQNDVALAGFTDVVARMRTLYPGPHPRLAIALVGQSFALSALGRCAEAETAANEALAIRNEKTPYDGNALAEADAAIAASQASRHDNKTARATILQAQQLLLKQHYPDSLIVARLKKLQASLPRRDQYQL